MIRGRVLVDAGAFADWSVEGIAGTMVAGPYRWQAWDLRSYGALTNRFGTGAYRAPGAPTAEAFAEVFRTRTPEEWERWAAEHDPPLAAVAD